MSTATGAGKKAVAIVSGGMDSVTLAYLLRSEGYDLRLLSIDYGQRHAKSGIRRLATWDRVDLDGR